MWELMKSEEVDIEILKHQLILRGWLRIPPKVIVHELLNSFGRLNREPDELCVCFIDEISAEFREAINRAEEGFKIELRHHDKKITHKTNCCIPTIILAKAIIEYSVPRSISRFDRWSCDLFGMMYTATPIASIIFQFGTEALNFSVYEIIYTTYSLLMCWLVSTRFLTYIIVGVVDVKRKMFLMEQCSAFITSRESNNSFLEYYKIPRFDMSDVKTIDSWYTMRTAFIDLGRRYTYRIFIYTSLILPLCVFTIVILILQLFIKVEIINVSALTAVIFLSFSCSLYIVYMLVIGSKVNDMFQRHRDLIVTCSNDALHLRKLEDVIEPEVFQALDLVGDKLDQDERQRPLKILGMKADKILLSKLYALIASGFVSLIQIGITPSGESEKVS